MAFRIRRFDESPNQKDSRFVEPHNFTGKDKLWMELRSEIGMVLIAGYAGEGARAIHSYVMLASV